MTERAIPYDTRYPDLEGRTVFISGGATGIGAALVEAFAVQQADVHFIDIDTDAGSALANRLGSETGNQPNFTPCDVTDTNALMACIGAAHAAGTGLGVLVNNAANDQRMPVDEVTPEDWDRLVSVNLKHQFFAAQAAARVMAEQAAGSGGSIINFGSIAPVIGVPNLAVYSSAKSAAAGLTRSLARDLGAVGIRVNSVVPGAILTERQRRDWISPKDEARIIEQQCLKRPMVEADVAEMVLFLASNASRGCTGAEFRVDGGYF